MYVDTLPVVFSGWSVWYMVSASSDVPNQAGTVLLKPWRRELCTIDMVFLDASSLEPFYYLNNVVGA